MFDFFAFWDNLSWTFRSSDLTADYSANKTIIHPIMQNLCRSPNFALINPRSDRINNPVSLLDEYSRGDHNMALPGRTALSAQLRTRTPAILTCHNLHVVRCVATEGGDGRPRLPIVVTVFATRSLCGLPAVLAAAAVTVRSASARGTEWQPRRHHRRLDKEEWRELSKVLPLSPIRRLSWKSVGIHK